MIKLDFKQDAVAFVIKHNCASSTPAPLIEEAMKHGACAALIEAKKSIKEVSDDLDNRRSRNISPSSGISKVVLP